MQPNLTAFLACCFAAALISDTLAQAPAGWTQVWSDEFTQADGTSPDAAKWGFDVGGTGWGNNELQYYTSRTTNARIESGNLVIEAKAESYGGRNYTSARLLTKNKASWTYGRMEARIKIAKGQGIWPAFWMLGANIDAVGWPQCGEIDIMENIGSEPSIVHGTLHGPGYSGGDGISGDHTLSGGALADAFHVFAVEWEASRIRWFIDGLEYFTLTPGQLPGGTTWVFNQPQFLLLNLAVGGNWPGAPNGSTVFPQRMTVDYVRVFQRDTVVVPPTVVNVTVDPAASWLGYMNVYNLPANDGAFRSGGLWDTSALSAEFTGPTLNLKPNSITDPSPYWYIGGGAPGRPGNKIMNANLYVEKTGTLSGKTINFTGKVLGNTLTAAHASVAFIKDFSPDYSSFNVVTAPLNQGVFNLSLATTGGETRHVQYGFETTGVNVWATDVAPYGSVQITAATANPIFSAWISSLNFAAFTSPDLTPSGDPDGDGHNNITEFALAGNPTTGKNSGTIRSRVEQVAGGKALVITLPVRGAPTFAGAPGKSATVDQVTYTIEGSNGNAIFDQAVSEISANPEGMPTLESGWAYRTFRLSGVIDGPTPRGPRGFLRVRIQTP